MENLKFKLGDRIVYTGGDMGKRETGTIVGIDIDARNSVIPYALCLDNGRGYHTIDLYKTTVNWLENFGKNNVDRLILWASNSELELLREDESIKIQFNTVRDRKRVELEEIDKQIEEYKRGIEELEDRRNAIKMDYYL